MRAADARGAEAPVGAMPLDRAASRFVVARMGVPAPRVLRRVLGRLAGAVVTATAAVALVAPGAASADGWEAPQVVGSDGGKYPAVAVGHDGVVHAAWQGPNAIFYNAKAGTPWQSPTLIAATPAAASRQYGPGPLIGVDNQGVVTIAWREQAPDGRLIIKAARRAPNGAITAEVVGAGAFGGNSFALDVADNGAAAIVYFSGTAGGGQMQVATRAAGAAEFADPEVPGVPGQPHEYPFDAPFVDIADNGTLAAGYSPSAPTVAVKPAGFGWEIFTNVGAPDAGINANANVVVEPNGDVVLAYFEQAPGPGGDRELTVRERPAGQFTDFGPAEHVVGGPTGRNHADVLSPVAMARGGDGVITFAWRQEAAANLHAIVVARRPDGGPFEPVGALFAPGGPYENVRVAADGTGNTIVSWRGFDDPSKTGSMQPSENTGPVFATTRPAGGSFSQPAQISGTGSAAIALAMRNGVGVAAYQRGYLNTGCVQIEATVFTAKPATTIPPVDSTCSATGSGASAGSPPPSTQTPGTADSTDTAAPRVRINRRAQTFVKHRRLTLTFTCNEACTGNVRGSVRHKPRNGKKKMRSVKLSVSKFRGSAGRNVAVRYKLSAGQVTAIKKMLTKKGKATFVASISFVDSSGNRGKATARIALKR